MRYVHTFVAAFLLTGGMAALADTDANKEDARDMNVDEMSHEEGKAQGDKHMAGDVADTEAGVYGEEPELALDADQARAEIVEVDTEASKLKVKIVDAGQITGVKAGDVKEYKVTEETELEHQEEPTESLLSPIVMRLGDLDPGDRVVLGFADVQGETTIIEISEDTKVSEDETMSDTSS